MMPSSARPLAVLLLVTATVAACSRGEPPPPAEPPVPEAGYVTIAAQPFTLVNELPGRTAPYQVAEVRPQVTGILEQRLFDEGETVTAGQPLYRIDDKLYRAAVASARADLASAKATLEAARLKAERYDKLGASAVVSRQTRDEALAARDEALARVAAAEAAVQSADINLAYTTITAPIDGVVGRSAVTAGALVTANQAEALVVIRQLDPIYVDLTRSFDELQALRADMAEGRFETVGRYEARVNLIGPDGWRYAHRGVLQFSEFAVDEATGSVILRALFPNPDQALLPGMFVRAELPQAERRDAILVPQRALTREPNGQAIVHVIDAQDIVRRREVTAERAVEARWLILEGLAPGERIVVDGLQKIRPDGPVRPITVDLPAAAPADAAGARRD